MTWPQESFSDPSQSLVTVRPKSKMKLEDLLEIIGEFGWYQKRLYFLLCLTAVTCGIHSFLPVFHVATPDFRCALPGYPDDTYAIQSPYHSFLINRSIPIVYKDFRYQFDKCEMYVTSQGNVTQNVTSHGNSTESCDAWVYERKSGMASSAVTQMNVVCDQKTQQSTMKMAFLAGKLVGSLVLGVAADYLGRKKMLLLSSFIQFAAGIGNAFVTNVAAYCVCRFFDGVASSGLFVSAFVMGMELVGKSKRMWAGIVIEVFFALGGVIMVALAYLIRNWFTLQIVVSVPSALFALYWWLLPESARWLISQGRVEEATVILEKIADSNKTKLPDDLDLTDDTKNGPKTQLWEICSTKTLALRTAVIFFNWAVASATYYGLSLNSGALHKNLFLGSFLSFFIELPAYILCMLLLDRIGRKYLHTSMMLLGGAANLCTIFSVLYAGVDQQWITVALALIGKMGASAAFAIIYVYTSELYPTVLRNGAVGSSSMVSRIGAIMSPYIADIENVITTDFGKALPLAIFGAFSVAAGLSALLLPETLNQPLPDTIEEAKNFGKPGWKDRCQIVAVAHSPIIITEQPARKDDNVELKSYISM